MHTVYSAAHAVDAHMIANLLQQSGIDAQVFGEFLTGAAGELPPGALVRVVVPHLEQVEVAKRIIDEWETARPVSSPEEHPATTPFNPAAPARDGRDAGRNRLWQGVLMFGLGAIFATAVTWLYYRTPMTRTATDYDGDGHPEERYLYRGDSPVRSEYDRNGDRKTDVIYLYDQRGVAETSKNDDDFDGRFETEVTFRFGQPAGASTDRDGDGFVDEVTRFVSGVGTEFDYLGGESRRIVLKRLFIKPGDEGDYALLDTDRDGLFDLRDDYDSIGESQKKTPISPPTRPTP